MEQQNYEITKLRINGTTKEIDLIEEIGRLQDFNYFITCLPIMQKTGH